MVNELQLISDIILLLILLSNSVQTQDLKPYKEVYSKGAILRIISHGFGTQWEIGKIIYMYTPQKNQGSKFVWPFKEYKCTKFSNNIRGSNHVNCLHSGFKKNEGPKKWWNLACDRVEGNKVNWDEEILSKA